MRSRVRTLLVYVHYPDRLAYFDDWRDAFESAPELDVIGANLATPTGRRRLRRRVRDVDLVVLLHSVIGDSLREIARCTVELQRRRAPLLAFVGNEVTLVSQPFAAKLAALRELGAEVIGTQLLPDAAEYLYAGLDSVRVVPLPHALNPAVFRPMIPSRRRTIDVGFRGARYLPEIGDDDRNRLVDRFAAGELPPGLRVDVRTGPTLSRRRWSRFLNRCRATIGAESGSFYISPDDDVLAGLAPDARPGRPLSSRPLLSSTRYLPPMLKGPIRRAAQRLRSRPPETAFSPSVARAPAYGKCISSRHFEAIGTETCQILLRGRYNDLLEADRHYLALDPDFANLDEVLDRLADESLRRQLVREARAWALEAHTYGHRVNEAIAAVTDAA